VRNKRTEYLDRLTYTLPYVPHDFSERTSDVSCGPLRLSGSKLAVKVKFELQSAVMRQRHHDQVALSILGNKNRLTRLVCKVRDLMRLITEIGYWFDDGHRRSSYYQNYITIRIDSICASIFPESGRSG
jgi:hypothetical protein